MIRLGLVPPLSPVAVLYHAKNCAALLLMTRGSLLKDSRHLRDGMLAMTALGTFYELVSTGPANIS